VPGCHQGIERSKRTRERWIIAEVLRIKGGLLLRQGGEGATAEAERHFREALDIARQQGALSWELRAANSLAQLWHGHSKSGDAYRLLSSIYNRFNEGFETCDLRTACAMMEKLRASPALIGLRRSW
jgi:predicted ATPase